MDGWIEGWIDGRLGLDDGIAVGLDMTGSLWDWLAGSLWDWTTGSLWDWTTGSLWISKLQFTELGGFPDFGDTGTNSRFGWGCRAAGVGRARNIDGWIRGTRREDRYPDPQHAEMDRKIAEVCYWRQSHRRSAVNAEKELSSLPDHQRLWDKNWVEADSVAKCDALGEGSSKNLKVLDPQMSQRSSGSAELSLRAPGPPYDPKGNMRDRLKLKDSWLYLNVPYVRYSRKTVRRHVAEAS
ncbi:hypothetical protein E2P81_ATG10949 [Venturia nashicola]|nr:hypothetical protein E2P81_ATG10949 [Venturia nashicola]